MLLALTSTIVVTGCGAADSTSKNGNAVGNQTVAESTATTNGNDLHRPPARQLRVVLLGTSLTAGLGLDPAVAYPALLQKKVDSVGYPVTVVGAGLSGETSAGALRRATWVLDQPAAVVVLEVGANDGLRGVDPDTTKANLMALIDLIHKEQPAARVVLVQMEAPTNFGRAYTTQFHNAYVQAAKEKGVTLLPFLLDGVAGIPRLNQGDGIHPNAEGSVVVANTMWQGLAPILAELSHQK